MRFTLPLVVMILLVSPALAFAAGIDFSAIRPEECACPGGAPGSACIGLTMNNILQLMLVLGAVFVLFQLLWAGFLFILNAFPQSDLLEGDKKSDKKTLVERGKRAFMTGVISFVGIVGAYTTVDTVATLIIDPDKFGKSSWEELMAEGDACICPEGGCNGQSNNGNTNNGNDDDEEEDTEEDPVATECGTNNDSATDANRTTLREGGVCVDSSGNCNNSNNSTCTVVMGLSNVTINHLIGLKADCNCMVTVTGGLEPGHQTHNSKTVDLRLSQQLNSFIEALPPATANQLSGTGIIQGSANVYADSCNNVYLREGGSDPHWHLYIRDACF